MMTKKELIDVIAESADVSHASAERAFTALTDSIINTLVAGEKVTVAGFGNFETGQRAARQGRNPQTGETIQIAASTSVKFKAAKKFKDAVNHK